MKADNDQQLRTLQGEDAAYMRALVKYLRSKLSVDPVAIEDVIHDLLEGFQAANASGKTAVEYFGDTPKLAAQQILQELLRRSGWQYFDLWWPWVTVFAAMFVANGLLGHLPAAWDISDVLSLGAPLVVLVTNWLLRDHDFDHPKQRTKRIIMTFIVADLVFATMGYAWAAAGDPIALPLSVPMLVISGMITLNAIRLFHYWNSLWWCIFWVLTGICTLIMASQALLSLFLLVLAAFVMVVYLAPLWRRYSA